MYNTGYCNWNNFSIRAKVEEQQGSTRRACATSIINLPARSQITIQIDYNNINRTISFIVGNTVPLSNGLLAIPLNELSVYNNVATDVKILFSDNNNFGTIQCVYLKMVFATECGAQFTCN